MGAGDRRPAGLCVESSIGPSPPTLRTRALGPAFKAGLGGAPSALFCDSWEVHKHRLWSPELWDSFEERYGYSLREYADELDAHLEVRYDYRRFIGQTVVREFYACFNDICHELGALSRVQCHGAPADLLSAYSVVDIPESEALLFEPPFSRIAASAAAFSGKQVVSCETFTCIYGFVTPLDRKPLRYWRKENVADLKLLADALFANGVNQIVWHGMPFNAPDGEHEFYAAVHVGPDCSFADELRPFNAYLERVSTAMKRGRPYCGLAVYLPNEDAMMRPGYPPPEDRVPAEQDYWEMRYIAPPKETQGYHPLWASEALLAEATVDEGALVFGDMTAPGLYIDVNWLDGAALDEVFRLARAGQRLVLRTRPQEPGHRKRDDFETKLDQLSALPNVVKNLNDLKIQPLLEGSELPWYWAREDEEGLHAFFAHPCARGIAYPMPYGYSANAVPEKCDFVVHFGGRKTQVTLDFERLESVLLHIGAYGAIQKEALAYTPPAPIESLGLPAHANVQNRPLKDF